MSIDIIYDDNNQITTDEISQLVQEVLNIVDTPKVKYPAGRMIKIKGIYKIIYCVFFHIFVILSNGNKFIQKGCG